MKEVSDDDDRIWKKEDEEEGIDITDDWVMMERKK